MLFGLRPLQKNVTVICRQTVDVLYGKVYDIYIYSNHWDFVAGQRERGAEEPSVRDPNSRCVCIINLTTTEKSSDSATGVITPPHPPHEIGWEGTRVSVVRCRELTASAMAGPRILCYCMSVKLSINYIIIRVKQEEIL